MNGATSPNRDIESPATERTLVLCFDGTSEIYDDHNSNVVKLFSFLEKESPAQLVYYQVRLFTGIHKPLFQGFPVLLACRRVSARMEDRSSSRQSLAGSKGSWMKPLRGH